MRGKGVKERGAAEAQKNSRKRARKLLFRTAAVGPARPATTTLAATAATAVATKRGVDRFGCATRQKGEKYGTVLSGVFSTNHRNVGVGDTLENGLVLFSKKAILILFFLRNYRDGEHVLAHAFVGGVRGPGAHDVEYLKVETDLAHV